MLASFAFGMLWHILAYLGREVHDYMIPPKPIKPHPGETDDMGDRKRVHHESLTKHAFADFRVVNRWNVRNVKELMIDYSQGPVR